MIVKPSEFMKSDSRFKRWGKLFTANEFEPSEKDGYSLKGRFVKWNESVPLFHGQFMVVAAQHGPRRRQTYAYCPVMGGDEPGVNHSSGAGGPRPWPGCARWPGPRGRCGQRGG